MKDYLATIGIAALLVLAWSMLILAGLTATSWLFHGATPVTSALGAAAIGAGAGYLGVVLVFWMLDKVLR